jgi:hypothetical protein
MMSLENSQYIVDVVRGRCHVLHNVDMKSIYSSEKAFEVLNYALNNISSFKISDIFGMWIDLESHEELMKGIREKSELFQSNP